MTNSEVFVNATSSALGVPLRYKLETIGATDVYTDIGHITDYSSGTTGWTIQSDALGGLGLVEVVNFSSATITANISGQVVSLSSQLPNLSGLYLASGLWLASGLNVVLPLTSVSGNVVNVSGITGTVAVSLVSSPLTIPNYIVQNPPTALSGTAPINVAVTASSGQVLAVNASRKGAAFVNLSGNIISFGLGTSTNLGLGITLNTLGGTWVMDQFTYTTQQIQAISNVSGSGLGIQEFV